MRLDRPLFHARYSSDLEKIHVFDEPEQKDSPLPLR